MSGIVGNITSETATEQSILETSVSSSWNSLCCWSTVGSSLPPLHNSLQFLKFSEVTMPLFYAPQHNKLSHLPIIIETNWFGLHTFYLKLRVSIEVAMAKAALEYLFYLYLLRKNRVRIAANFSHCFHTMQYLASFEVHRSYIAILKCSGAIIMYWLSHCWLQSLKPHQAFWNCPIGREAETQK